MTAKAKKKAATSKALFNAMISTLQVDADKATGRGIEFIIPGICTLMIHYAGPSNAAYIKATKDALERAGDRKNLTPEQMEQFLADLYAKHVIVGLKDVIGNDVPYDADAQTECAAMLMKLPEIFTLLREAAQNAAHFRAKQTEAAAKN